MTHTHLLCYNHTSTTEIYTLSLHDLFRSILCGGCQTAGCRAGFGKTKCDFQKNVMYALTRRARPRDRKSTRLNSSHLGISYAVFCLKKKKIDRQSRISHKRRSLD